MTNRKKHAKVKEQLGEVFESQIKERRGRPLQRRKFPPPDELLAITTFQKERAGESYMRLAAMARDTKLRKSKPALYVDIQKFLYEVAYPKKTVFDPDTGYPIQVSFEVVNNPKEIKDPRFLSEAKVIEVEPPKLEYESSRTEKADITNAATTD